MTRSPPPVQTASAPQSGEKNECAKGCEKCASLENMCAQAIAWCQAIWVQFGYGYDYGRQLHSGNASFEVQHPPPSGYGYSGGVCGEYVGDPGIFDTALHGDLRYGTYGSQRDWVHRGDARHGYNEIDLCQSIGGYAQNATANGAGTNVGDVRKIAHVTRGFDPDEATASPRSRPTATTNSEAADKGRLGNNGRVENCQQVGGDSGTDIEKFHRHIPDGSGRGLGGADEVCEVGALPTGQVLSDKRGNGAGDRAAASNDTTQRTFEQRNDKYDEHDDAEHTAHAGHNARDKTRCDQAINGGGSSGNGRPKHGNASSQTQADRDNGAICGRNRHHRARNGNPKGDRTVIERKMGIRRRPTQLPTASEEATLPLHAKAVNTIDLSKLQRMMNDVVRDRFKTLYAALLAPPVHSEYRRANILTPQDLELLHSTGIIERATSAKTTGWIIPFTTVEERDGNKRRRFISWTRDANDALEHYKSEIQLGRVVEQVRKVHFPCGVKRDLTAGFYQIAIPQGARQAFRFRGNAGELWQLTRMPMGHVCAPELMQIVTAVLAGDPAHCTEGAVLTNNVDVYVDGFRAVGTELDMRQYETRIEERAQQVGATFKAADSVRGSRYEFNGVQYDHGQRTVTLSTKLRKKLNGFNDARVTLGSLETLMGQLLYASRIVATNLPKYYFVMKYARRRINDLNRGISVPEDALTLPGGVRKAIRQWIKEVTALEAYVPPKELPANAALHLFTDASQKGWGAILLMPTGEILATGNRWSGDTPHINVAEIDAVKHAFGAFADSIPTGGNVMLHVDNTSAEAALRKYMTRSEDLTTVLAPVVDDVLRKRILLRVVRVASKDNPADRLSRQ